MTALQAPVPPLPPVPPDVGLIVSSGPPVGAIVATVLLVVAGVLLLPVMRAWARRLERGAVPVEALDELEHLRERVAELEPLAQRVAELEERLDFAERLLTRPAPESLPREAQR
jgi:cytochrome c-type biogenesis protein CcmH/NrfG